jgi:hypothetical protein
MQQHLSQPTKIQTKDRHRQRKREKKKETDAQHSSHASPLDYKSAKHFPHNYEVTDLQNLTRATENTTHTRIQSNYNTKRTQNLQQVLQDRATTKWKTMTANCCCCCYCCYCRETTRSVREDSHNCIFAELSLVGARQKKKREKLQR